VDLSSGPAWLRSHRRRRDRNQAGPEDRSTQALECSLRSDHSDPEPRPLPSPRPARVRQDRRRYAYPGLVALAADHQDLPLHALREVAAITALTAFAEVPIGATAGSRPGLLLRPGARLRTSAGRRASRGARPSPPRRRGAG